MLLPSGTMSFIFIHCKYLLAVSTGDGIMSVHLKCDLNGFFSLPFHITHALIMTRYLVTSENRLSIRIVFTMYTKQRRL